MRIHLFGTGLVVFIASLSGCILANDDGASTTGTATTVSGGNGGSSNGSGGNTTNGTGGSTNTSTTTTSGSGGDGGGAIGSCADATLFAGDPFFDGELSGWNPAGQPALGDPPLRHRHLAASNGRIFIDTEFEVWFTDAANVKRAAGDETEQDTKYQPSGACSTVRFLNIGGIATLPNGHLVVADIRGNGVVELTDPTGSCTAASIAGNATAIDDTDINGEVANPGDVDGPGASAKFVGVTRPTADAAGNVYVIDQGNSKIKKIANDAARTVTTLYAYGNVDARLPLAMTVMGSKLYVTGSTVTKDFLWSLDTTTPGDPTVIYMKTGVFDEIDSSKEAILSGLDNDGTDLIVSSNKGYIFRMSTAGVELGVVAGMGQIVDYPTAAELDVTHPIPTADLPLKGFAINDGSLLVSGGNIYWPGAGANGLGMHIFRINCN